MGNLHYMYNFKCSLLQPKGNNVFSYEERLSKKLVIPPLKEGYPFEISQSDEYAFIEIDEKGQEQTCKGLKSFIRYKNIFIFDNHNHSYFFYKMFLKENNLKKLDFIHVDQHKDMRTPDLSLKDFISDNRNLRESLLNLGIDEEEYNFLKAKKNFEELASWFLYTNLGLNVGNFIKPLLEEGLINKLEIIDSEYTMENFFQEDEKYVLDLDLDFFAPEMSYINREKKIDFIKKLMNRAEAVFIATSPYFIEYETCVEVLKELDLYHC